MGRESEGIHGQVSGKVPGAWALAASSAQCAQHLGQSLAPRACGAVEAANAGTNGGANSGDSGLRRSPGCQCGCGGVTARGGNSHFCICCSARRLPATSVHLVLLTGLQMSMAGLESPFARLWGGWARSRPQVCSRSAPPACHPLLGQWPKAHSAKWQELQCQPTAARLGCGGSRRVCGRSAGQRGACGRAPT